MKNSIVEQEVQKAQEALDALGIMSLVYAKKDPDNGQWILCGDYKERGRLNTWTERMDKFYTDCNLFVAFFKQRAKFLLATKEEQIAFEGHPATF